MTKEGNEDQNMTHEKRASKRKQEITKSKTQTMTNTTWIKLSSLIDTCHVNMLRSLNKTKLKHKFCYNNKHHAVLNLML